MSGAALLLALAGLAAPAGDLVARAACDPASAAVGEPVRVVIEIAHDEGVDVRGLLEKPLELGPSWVLLGREIEPPRADPAHPEQFVSRCVLSVASLEPGAQSLATELSSAFQDERLASFDASAAHVDVASVLAEGEDAPRPLRGLPESFGASAGEAGRRVLPWFVAGAALVVLAGAAHVVRRERARRARAVASEDPLAALEGFAPARGIPAGALRERAYELSRFLRTAVDRRLSLAHDGLTDEEWLAALESSGSRSGFGPELVTELRDFCARTESIKYAGAEPSEWTHGELVASARRALELVIAGPAPAPVEEEAA